MNARILVSFALASTLLCSLSAAPQLVPDGQAGTNITPDGKFVMGNGNGGALRWDWKNDVVPISIGGNTACVAYPPPARLSLGKISEGSLRQCRIPRRRGAGQALARCSAQHDLLLWSTDE